MTTNGRDSSGKFVPGNPGGPGRPPRATEESYLATMRETISQQDWKEICKRALKDAKAGDHKARQWIADFLIGRTIPLSAEQTDPTGEKPYQPEVEQFKQHLGLVIRAESWADVLALLL